MKRNADDFRDGRSGPAPAAPAEPARRKQRPAHRLERGDARRCSCATKAHLLRGPGQFLSHELREAQGKIGLCCTEASVGTGWARVGVGRQDQDGRDGGRGSWRRRALVTSPARRLRGTKFDLV